ncbi:MAG: biopolymer transporter ExbD [Bacteroidetes bacterium]|nr:biopolymer transporter ExbD [Bacteroidota bacterium]
MNLRRNTKYTAEVYTGSLNDIMFFLLLFFLIVSTLASPSVVKLLLPQTKTSQAITKPQISLAVTQDKKYYINNKEIPASLLENELVKATLNATEPLIILRFDKALTIQDLVDVLQIGSKLKIKMVLATQTLNDSK